MGQALTVDEGFSSHDEREKQKFPIGTAGESLTDLRPAGKIRVGPDRIDAVSEGEFIDAGSKVTIIGWRSGNAVVREDSQT